VLDGNLIDQLISPMPSTPAETGSRDSILDAAERLFAAQGFTPTTIKQIGRAAGVNSALLYYYFADKDQLYREVLHRFVARLVERTMAAPAGRGPEAGLRAFIAAQADSLSDNPHFPRLLVRELLDFDAAHAVEQVQLLAATSFRKLCGLIEEGQRAGVFRRSVDPRFAAISVVAQLAYFTIARPAVRVLLRQPADGPSPDMVRAFAAHAADFAVSALAAAPPPRTSAARRAPRTRRKSG
jgi:TetR/AcrR family transcriptional regulator